MGRFYSMNDDDFSGKFVVGTQSSDDAQIFGLDYDYGRIRLCGGDMELVCSKLKELCKEAGIPYSEDLYKGTPDEVSKRCDELYDEFFKRKKIPEWVSSDLPSEEKDRIDRDALLIARIVMGIEIASCMERDGWVDMECEC